MASLLAQAGHAQSALLDCSHPSANSDLYSMSPLIIVVNVLKAAPGWPNVLYQIQGQFF